MRYTALTKGDPQKRLRLYLWNAELSAAMYAPLQGLEVILRNALHGELSTVYGSTWFDNQNLPFLPIQAKKLQEAKMGLTRLKRPILSADVVATLPLGFWVSLFGHDYDATLWRTCIYKAIVNRPQPFSRKSMHRELELIRHLRNRIAHHEPIIRTDLPLHHERILRMIRWFSDEFADWVASHSRFPDVWQSPDNPFLTDNKTSEL